MSLLESIPMFDVPMILPDDSPRAHRTDPITSHEAADSNDVPLSHRLVMQTVDMAGGRGLAQFQAEAWLDGQLSPSRVRSAFTELELLGKVARTDETRTTPSGRRAQVWVLS